VQRREYDALHVAHLETGHTWFINTGFADDEDLRAGWAQLRDAILAWHITECPGSRPWGWWHCEAPEPRQLLTGTPHVCAPRVRHQQQLYFGMPHVFGCPRCWEEVYESQARYLVRLHLLTPLEAARVPPDLDQADQWFTQCYGSIDEAPTPAGGLEACRALLAR
jgi:hypothetical protein